MARPAVREAPSDYAALRGTLVDSNMLIDVLPDDPRWADWSIAQMEGCGAQGPLVINPLILAELSPRFERAVDLDRALTLLPLRRAPCPGTPHISPDKRSRLTVASAAASARRCRISTSVRTHSSPICAC